MQGLLDRLEIGIFTGHTCASKWEIYSYCLKFKGQRSTMWGQPAALLPCSQSEVQMKSPAGG